MYFLSILINDNKNARHENTKNLILKYIEEFLLIDLNNDKFKNKLNNINNIENVFD